MTKRSAASKRPVITDPSPATPPSAARRGWLWGALAVLAATLPVAGVFSLDRIFFLRDLGLFFWDRHLWLRRSLFSGEWPLWDPYLAGGQSAAADALHQMFLLPVLALRMLGSEVVGFNLWIALPFPLAALGAYLFFRSRFSQAACAIGAAAFALSGPVVSTGNFPNMSWSVAALPWVLWAADRIRGPRDGRRVAALAVIVAFQAAAGEPVTLAATAALALAMAATLTDATGRATGASARVRAASAVAVGLAIGGAVAAVQIVPMAVAAGESWRALIRLRDFWSFHPLSLLETVAPNLFGDFLKGGTIESVPWQRALNVSREGFFFSIYLGPAVLAVAAFGLAAGWRRAWVGFWSVALAIGLVAAFGGHTPIYPAVRKFLPLVGSFRFPVKYLIVCAIAVASLAAYGWDALADERRREAEPARFRRARGVAVAVPTSVALFALLLLVGTTFLATPTARGIFDLANALGVRNPVDSSAFMLRSIGDVMPQTLVLAAASALLVAVAAGRRKESLVTRHALCALLVADLVLAAGGINPTCDVRLLTPPSWVATVRAHPDSRFYFGGKMAGTVEVGDADAPKDFSFLDSPSAMARRSEFVHQLIMFPAGMGVREMLSYDLAIMWPRIYETTHIRFVKADAAARERFLSRTAVRYRVLPVARAGGRPSMPVERFANVAMFDAGPSNTRAFVAPQATVVSDETAQLEAMFGEGWDGSQAAMLMTPPGAADGTPGTPVEPSARIVRDRADEVVVEAGAGQGGGFLVLLDSYDRGWQVRVDGRPAALYRANLLFRAVRLAPGRHDVEFRYRPRELFVGGALSVLGLLAAAAVAFGLRQGDGR